MKYLPIFLNICDKTGLVVGGGATATRKVELLLRANAKVTVVAPRLTEQLQNWVDEGRITYRADHFAPTDLQHCRLVIAATNDKAINEQVSMLAQAQGTPVNVVDQPQLCSFIMPSIIDRSPVQIAISTGGASPVLARLLRARLETLIPAAYGKLAEFVASFRLLVKQRLPFNERKSFWETVLQGPIAEMLLSGHTPAATKALENLIEKTASSPKKYGEVYLVGGGPGDPDLLTFRALRLMQQADVVLHDRLVSPGVLDLVRRDAELIFVGKQPTNHPVPQGKINQLLIRLAKEGKRVLRLKGGDPFLFGRGGEEIETLMDEGIPFQVVPGITAAVGTSAYAGIPLTHRDYAQSCTFVTGHLKDDSTDLNWDALAQPHQTVVIYMGLRSLPVISRELIRHGMPPDKPAALVQKATTSDHRVLVGTLETLPGIVEAADIKLSSIIIIGEVVKLHKKLAWFAPPVGNE
ncbi:MAG: uroporphyrinogen-III C-methyltransferase [Candidatus Parabeggiatoa sp. nov. 2]|nr:MAG: uroporphyrinogen-III C-methyltransferase [Beggiatoa sp. 4572_84]RKZ63672.1 MAG: uroporphyrinogen-III C-methyltransferase [Gammaproteobacteria bacterium]